MACRKAPSRAQYCCRTRRRRRPRRRGCRKSCRPGKLTRNPFFNYLRWFRKKHCGWSAVKVAVEGAKCWCRMSDQQRRKFYQEACRAPKSKRRSCSTRRKGRSCSRRRRKRSCSRRRKRRSCSRRRRKRSCSRRRRRRSCPRRRRKSRCGHKRRRRSSSCHKRRSTC
ncbi:protamine-like [Tribolium madens]|uniref:protamine-like n=1 Tax=Tribolium madens TaxID=41895 RepID=UPI001CF755AA|nr:protamine-like [Tribolium madens]